MLKRLNKNLSTESEIQALLSLLDDNDPAVYKAVGNKILSMGNTIIPLLEKEWESSLSSEVQERIENLIHIISFEELKVKLIDWKNSEEQSLLEGAYIVASYKYPDYTKDELEADVCQFYYEVWGYITEGMNDMDKIKAINYVLFQQLKFSANTKNFHSPKNSFLNNVIESRKGNPITLCVLYLLITEKLELPISGVNLPNLFVLTFKDEIQQFYINVFNRGLVFSKEDIERYIEQLKIESQESFFEPCDTLTIVKRMLQNLVYAYEKDNDNEKKEEVSELLSILLMVD